MSIPAKCGTASSKSSTITIDESGHLRIPMEVNQVLKLRNNELLKVSVKSDHILIIPSSSELDDDLIEALIHEGIIIVPTKK